MSVASTDFPSARWRRVVAHPHRGSDTMTGGFSNILRKSRWRPYLFGAAASLPLALVMLQVWKYYEPVALGWLVCFAFFGGLGVFWRTPTGRLVVTAITLGTVIPLVFL